jgi:purine-nucleoside phosphorylase
MTNLRELISQSTSAIRNHTSMRPKVGIILGTGLGMVANEIEQPLSVPYSEIPHFAESTVETHQGRLIFGTINSVEVVVMQGRFHYYEGYTMQQITHPVRVMKELGIETLIVSNACGALNPQFRKSDIMLITDHINLLGDNPLIGPNDPAIGVRFPDMSQPYTTALTELAEQCALDLKIKVQKGVYVAVAGPNLETRAEYRFLRGIGADVVGMSTIPEVIVAVHSSLKVLGISVITDECFPDALHPVSMKEIVESASIAEPKMTALVREFLGRLQ